MSISNFFFLLRPIIGESVSIRLMTTGPSFIMYIPFYIHQSTSKLFLHSNKPKSNKMIYTNENYVLKVK